MNKQHIKTGYKISYICVAFLLFSIMLYCVIYSEDLLTLLIALGFLIFSVIGGISPFFDKLTINDTFIEVKRSFRRKRINIDEITNIVILHNQAFVKSEKKHIYITQDFESWREVSIELRKKFAAKRNLAN
ncbi:MAG TPA: hypothetical protein VF721_07610 [Pyrinomonadaceae bacterium]|jgi:hypothetical protein